MKLTHYFVIAIVSFCCFSGTVLGQKKSETSSSASKLPPLSHSVGCGLMLRYIDDALEKADSSGSNIILVIKMKNIINLSLAQTRSNNLKNYVRFRGFRNFEVVVDLNSSRADQIDLHVNGKILYSIPIKSTDKLNFSGC